MDEAKHSPLPWFVHDFTSAVPNPCCGDVTVSCDHPATVRVAAMGRAMTATVDEAQANADFIVLACNSYDANQATIAAQAARIGWLERAVTEDEVRMAYSSIAQSHLIGVRAFPDALAAALEFRMRAAK